MTARKKRSAVDGAPAFSNQPREPKKVTARDNWQKFLELRASYPNSVFVIKQVAPYVNEGIQPVGVSMFDNFSGLVQWLQQRYWTGEASAYFYSVYDDQDLVGDGQIEIAADPRKAPSSGRDDGPFGQYGAPPGFFPPPGHVQQGAGYLPNPFQVQPPYALPYPAPQPPAPQPLPPPQIQIPNGTDNEVVRHLVAQVERMSSMYASLYEAHRVLLAQQNNLAAPPPGYPPSFAPPGMAPPVPLAPGIVGPAPAPAQKIKSPIEEMKEAVNTMREISQMVRTITDENAPAEKEEDPKKKEEENFPFKIKELPHMRFVTTEKGDPVDMTTTLMMNGDKISDFAKNMVEKVEKMFKEGAEQREKERSAQLAMLREALQIKRQAMEPAPAPQLVGTPAPVPAPPVPAQKPVAAPPKTAARSFGSGRRVVDLSAPSFLKPVPEPVDDTPISVDRLPRPGPISEGEKADSGVEVAKTAG